MKVAWDKVVIILACLVSATVLGAMRVIEPAIVGGLYGTVLGTVISNGRMLRTGEPPEPIVQRRPAPALVTTVEHEPIDLIRAEPANRESLSLAFPEAAVRRLRPVDPPPGWDDGKDGPWRD